MDNRQGQLFLKYFQPLEAMLKLQKRACLCHLSTFVCTFSWAWFFSDEEFWNVSHNIQCSRNITIWNNKHTVGVGGVVPSRCMVQEMFQCSVVLLWLLGYLAKSKADLSKNPGKAQVNRPTLLRSLFTLGLLCKQFDFDSDVKPKNEVSSLVLPLLKLRSTIWL